MVEEWNLFVKKVCEVTHSSTWIDTCVFLPLFDVFSVSVCRFPLFIKCRPIVHRVLMHEHTTFCFDKDYVRIETSHRFDCSHFQLVLKLIKTQDNMPLSVFIKLFYVFSRGPPFYFLAYVTFFSAWTMLRQLYFRASAISLKTGPAYARSKDIERTCISITQRPTKLLQCTKIKISDLKACIVLSDVYRPMKQLRSRS